MFDFSSQTTPTPLECFCEHHARHARYSRLIRRCASYAVGAFLAAMSIHELLLFMWIGPDYLIAIAILEAFGAYALLRPLLSIAAISTTERKTEECLNQLNSLSPRGSRSIRVVKPSQRTPSSPKPLRS